MDSKRVIFLRVCLGDLSYPFLGRLICREMVDRITCNIVNIKATSRGRFPFCSRIIISLRAQDIRFNTVN